MPSAARFLLIPQGSNQLDWLNNATEGLTGQAVEIPRGFLASSIIKYDPCGLFWSSNIFRYVG